MSLWLESLYLCLYDYSEDLEERAKCILEHFSMNVPRSWWEKALDTGEISDAYINILINARNELFKIIKSPESINLGFLIALAFTEQPEGNRETRDKSVEDYLASAKEILANQKGLRELAEKINKKAIL